MSLDITLLDGGFGPSIEGWGALRDQVFSNQGALLQQGRMRFGDVRDALEFDGARVGCRIHLSFADIDRLLCQLLFELAERARLFILVVDAPGILRPPSLHGAEFDRGTVPILDMDSAEALFQYFQPQHEGV
jgi:hypothetical protein